MPLYAERQKENKRMFVDTAFGQNNAMKRPDYGFIDNRLPKQKTPNQIQLMAHREPVIQRGISNITYNAPNYSEADLTHPRATGTSPSSNPPGWCEPFSASNPSNQGQTHPHHHERGHLIGKQFGGTGGLKNIVTMTDATNGYYMLDHEKSLANYIDSNKTSTVYYKVTAKYSTFTDKNKHGEAFLKNPAPRSITMYAKDKTKNTVILNTDVTNGYIYNSHGCDW